jgi:hypothetical protein
MKKVDLINNNSKSPARDSSNLQQYGRNFIRDQSTSKIVRNDQPTADYHQMRRVNEDGCH